MARSAPTQQLEGPTMSHTQLVTALTAPGAAPLEAVFSTDGAGSIDCHMRGRAFPLIAQAGTITHGGQSATSYTTRGPVTPGVDDVFVVAEDGNVYPHAKAFKAGAAPLCDLADPGARAVIVGHMKVTLTSRMCS
jgi:hypothetical protein